ncbi:hypothetical protein J2Z21_009500 [Streptomyces griseochromogenes]|uniref:Uncharacterized protein n=1 Tax=Streptomyces griseochromogenes TaxID=68214 RepID=A0ABS4M9Y2_9ACTN|nr:hypothetical protein [Streptomyces griseochromogenes]
MLSHLPTEPTHRRSAKAGDACKALSKAEATPQGSVQRNAVGTAPPAESGTNSTTEPTC